MFRVSLCVFCYISALFDYMCMRLQWTDFQIRFSVLIEMFVTSISFRGTFKSFWDLTGKSTILVQSVLLWISQPDFQHQSINSMVHCGSAFEPGASGLPYTPTVCVPDARLLHTTCVRSWCNWRASCVVAKHKKTNPGVPASRYRWLVST